MLNENDKVKLMRNFKFDEKGCNFIEVVQNKYFNTLLCLYLYRSSHIVQKQRIFKMWVTLWKGKKKLSRVLRFRTYTQSAQNCLCMILFIDTSVMYEQKFNWLERGWNCNHFDVHVCENCLSWIYDRSNIKLVVILLKFKNEINKK